ncbi:MAG: argininosuccinate synthase [Gammaproteobacteria bacterium]|nr:argininosuccinate synthase [Gammaproteobacteria bacterium]NIR83086.1 argininosuccinate synthase [Gammaproteobacteria bacterium]NIR90748.1 argininosuccinate synthase [Gammaproteobacteria bacterium]NIU04239.1 argininosuccinate synthase [Gammaproteobacteria bacterium]NIV51531.1 argininosuccinate synthase [Gammaproteobacteria bacterium]
MDERLKQRLVGAAILVSLAIIFVPMVLDVEPEAERRFIVDDIPDRPGRDVAYPVMPLEDGDVPSGSAVSDAERGPPAAVQDPATSRAAAEGEGDGASGEPQREPASTDVTAVNAWAVQLGSFARSQNAVALRDRLRAKGYTAFLESARSDQGPVTRVYVGPELRRAQAEQALKKLQGEVDLKGIVVRYPGG